MDQHTASLWNLLRHGNKEERYTAYLQLLEVTGRPVIWTYEVWDDLVAWLQSGDNHQRTIAAQLLCHLAASDPEQRFLRDAGRIFAVTYDSRFVTARHTLQAFWKAGRHDALVQAVVMQLYRTRFLDSDKEKNATLIRNDIVEALGKLGFATGDGRALDLARELTALETDPKYRAKYLAVLKKVTAAPAPGV